jgi:hypothetical protein
MCLVQFVLNLSTIIILENYELLILDMLIITFLFTRLSLLKNFLKISANELFGLEI